MTRRGCRSHPIEFQLRIIAKPNDLLHHPRKADGVLPHRTPAFLAHHLVHRSRRAGWGVFSCFSLKSTPLAPGKQAVDLIPTRSDSEAFRIKNIGEIPPRWRFLKLRCFDLWPTASFNTAWGNAPGIRKTRNFFGQRPYSIRVDWFEYGRWPNRFVPFSIPGALPLATIKMAVGQKTI